MMKSLNSYVKEISSTEEYIEGHVDHKVNTSKTKGRKMCRKYLRRPKGSSNDLNLGQMDLEAAFQQWNNFRTYHTDFPNSQPGVLRNQLQSLLVSEMIRRSRTALGPKQFIVLFVEICAENSSLQ